MRKLFKTCATLLLLAAAGINMAAFSQVANVRATWTSGNLEFTDTSGNEVMTVSPTSVNIGAAASLKLNGQPLTGTGTTLSEYAVTIHMADAGTAGSAFVSLPFPGTIKSLGVTNYVANATGATTFTAKIGGVVVTAPTWQLGATDAAGTFKGVVPTAADTVAANDVLEIASDGGSSSSMPCEFTVVVLRQ